MKYEDPRDGRSPGRVLWDEKRREDRVRGLDIRVLPLARADVGSGWLHSEDRLRALIGTPMTKERRFRVVRSEVPRTLSA